MLHGGTFYAEVVGLLLVDLGHDGVDDVLDLALLGGELLLGGLGVALHPLHGLLDGAHDGVLVVGAHLGLHVGLLDHVAHLVAVVLELVASLNALLHHLVLLLELGGLGDHALDVALGEAALVVGDGNLVLLARGLLHRGHVQDPVGVHVKGDLDLGHTTGHGGDAVQVELAQQVAVPGHGPLTLKHLDEHTGLVVGVRGERLGLLGRHGGVALDQGGHDATGGLQTKGQGSHVQQQEVVQLAPLVAARQDGGLDGGTVRHGLVGVDGLVQLLAAEEVGDEGLNLGDAGGATDKDDVVDDALVNLGVLEDLGDGGDGALEEVGAELLELGAGDDGLEVDVGEQGVDLDVGLGGGGEGALGALAGGAEAAEGALALGGVLALVLALELIDEVVDQTVVEVLTAKMGVTVGGLDLEDATGDLKDGDIEGTATKVVHGDGDVLGLVNAEGKGGGGGLVDHAEHVEAGDHTGVLGGLALGVVEVRGHGDDRLVHLFSEELSRILAELAKHLRGNFLGGELLVDVAALDFDVPVRVAHDGVRHLRALGGDLFHAPSNESLDAEEGIFGVHNRLSLGDLSHKLVTCFAVRDDRRRRALSFCVGNDGWFPTFHRRHSTVGGT
eukprot:195132_1